MHLFRIVFMWHSLAVHVILLSMITAAIALPIGTDTTKPTKEQEIAVRDDEAGLSSHQNAVADTSQQPPPRKKRKTAASDPQQPTERTSETSKTLDKILSEAQEKTIPREYIIAVVIEHGNVLIDRNHPQKWVEKKEVDPDANWVIAVIPVGTSVNPRVQGYQTIRDMVLESKFKWKRCQTVNKERPGVYGTRLTLINSHLVLEIGRVTMSQNTRAVLAKQMGVVLDQYLIDKLPNVPSIYQFLLLFHQVASEFLLADKHRVKISGSWDLSESSKFGVIFKKMVGKKGTGANGILSEERDKWECELYKRISSGAIKLDDSLWIYKNKDILEALWNEVHGIGLPASPQNPSLDPAMSSQHQPLHPATSSQH
ncbi:hypothetical protein FB446DRAFT_746457 [Lentinula raphanica]|nr:hypothetical protein FB446DRAFT_746457 [Lentinula raphanica]